MPYPYYLSIAGITLMLDSGHPLMENREFVPFLIGETAADVRAGFREVKRLPPVPEHLLYMDECCRIGLDARGNPRKYFFETPEDPVPYAASTYDRASGEIRVEYLGAYARCVSEVRSCFHLLGFEAILLNRDKLCLHAACVDTSLGGILFSGVSGIGKSTQAELWCRYRNARQINGDRPILSREGEGWAAWGSPYAGSSKCHVNDSCAVTAIVLLKQGDTCSARRLRPAEAFRGVWAGLTVRSWDVAFVDAASSLAIDLVMKVPVFEFSCTPDERAVDYLEQVLRKENAE